MSVSFFCAAILTALLLAAWCSLVKGNKDKALNANKVVLGDFPIFFCYFALCISQGLKVGHVLFFA